MESMESPCSSDEFFSTTSSEDGLGIDGGEELFPAATFDRLRTVIVESSARSKNGEEMDARGLGDSEKQEFIGVAPEDNLRLLEKLRDRCSK